MPARLEQSDTDGGKDNKRAEPRQLLRIQRKKMPNGLIKLELRYVSYQPSDNMPNDAEIASSALTALNQDLHRSLRNLRT